MDKTDRPRAKGCPEDVIHAGHAGLRCSIVRTDGKLTRLELADEPRGVVWADSKWDFLLVLRLDGMSFEATDVIVSDAVQEADGDGTTWRVTLTPCFNGPPVPACSLELQLRAPVTGGWLEERLLLRNTGGRNLEITALRAMLSSSVHGRQFHCFPVPFQECRAKPRLADLQAEPSFECRRDGAVLLEDGRGLVIARRPADFYEEPQFVGVRRTGDHVRFGGILTGVPSGLEHVELGPGECRDLGITRYIPFSGGLEDGLVLYRELMAQSGVRLPQGYAPPLNYCIYYECRERYHHEQLLQALHRAAEIGCTLLYTDQGWEDYFGSGRWDETRLGRLEDFVADAKALGLDVGVLVGMHTDAYVWPKDYWRKSPDGGPLFGDRWGAGHSIGICPTVPGWQKAKTDRLQNVVEAGVRFFSFDFNDNLEPCRDARHRHHVPLRGWEHALGVARQQQQIKRACPSVLIEAHDWEFAGSCTWPVYLFPDGHDELWGFEFMWDPFADLTSGRLYNLYYYNLAYEMPLYLHIDLTKDSEHRIVFWYAASTVRHLGVGNYAVLNGEQKAQVQQAVSIYRDHQAFFSAGRFDGAGPLTHIHTLPGQGAVVLHFNDQPQPAQGKLELTKDQVGCTGGIGGVSVVLGGQANVAGAPDRLAVEFSLKGYDVLLLRVQGA